MHSRTFLRSTPALSLKKSAALLSLLVTGGLFASSGGCSLGNVSVDDCQSNDQCASVFGLGSTCSEGYCTEPSPCSTGHDCRATAGSGACVEGRCVTTFPKDPDCQTIFEPEGLLDGPIGGPGAPLVIGSIFSLGSDKDKALTDAIRLAVREINAKEGLNKGQQLGVVVCDNGGPGNTATGADRRARNDHAIDYLAGTLGVPVIIGPLSSADSIQLTTRLKEKALPTVIISPSATSPDLSGIDDRLAPTDFGLFWRTCPSDDVQGKVLAEDVIGVDMAIQKVAVMYIDDAYGQGLSNVFLKAYGENRGKRFPISDVNDTAAVSAVAASVDTYAPDAVLIIAVQAGETVKILQGIAGKAVAQKKFFFTDGSKDAAKIFDPALSAEVKAILSKAKGTAPASPSGSNYNVFAANLQSKFGIDPSNFSFLAQAYDATYVGAYGIVWASREGAKYDGRQVADGLSRLSAGKIINLGSNDWLTGKTELTTQNQINVEGISGHLDFDAKVGEAPGRIEVWGVDLAGMAFTSEQILDP